MNFAKTYKTLLICVIMKVEVFMREIRVILNEPLSVEELNEHINNTVQLAVESIDESIKQKYDLKNRERIIDVLRLVMADSTIMNMSPSAFRKFMKDRHQITIPEKKSQEDLEEIITLREHSFRDDFQSYTSEVNREINAALSSVVVIANYQTLKNYSSEIGSPFEYLKKLSNEFSSLDRNPRLSIKFMPEELDFNDKVPQILNIDELHEFANLILHIRKNKLTPTGDLGIREYDADTDTSIEQVLRANSFVKTVAAEIKSKNLTPFETVLYVHNFCTEFGYTNRGGDERYGARLLKNAITGGNFNCVGFSTMFKAIIDQIGDPNIKIKFLHGTPTFDGANLNNEHGNLLLSVKDPQYEIDGHYVCDPSLNNSREPFGHNICCCMMPVDDLDTIEDFHYYYSEKCDRKRFYNEDLHQDKYTLSRKMIEQLEEEHFELMQKYVSPSISIETFELALKNMFKKSGASEYDAEGYAEDLMYQSFRASINLFDENSSNSFVLMAEELGLEPEAIIQWDSDEKKLKLRQTAGKENREKIESIVGPVL